MIPALTDLPAPAPLYAAFLAELRIRGFAGELSGDTLESKFMQLEAGGAGGEDDALNELKAKMGLLEAPKGVRLDSDAAIANRAEQIAIEAGYSAAMPPGNVSEITPQERALIVQWYREASRS